MNHLLELVWFSHRIIDIRFQIKLRTFWIRVNLIIKAEKDALKLCVSVARVNRLQLYVPQSILTPCTRTGNSFESTSKGWFFGWTFVCLIFSLIFGRSHYKSSTSVSLLLRSVSLIIALSAAHRCSSAPDSCEPVESGHFHWLRSSESDKLRLLANLSAENDIRLSMLLGRMSFLGRMGECQYKKMLCCLRRQYILKSCWIRSH